VSHFCWHCVRKLENIFDAPNNIWSVMQLRTIQIVNRNEVRKNIVVLPQITFHLTNSFIIIFCIVSSLKKFILILISYNQGNDPSVSYFIMKCLKSIHLFIVHSMIQPYFEIVHTLFLMGRRHIIVIIHRYYTFMVVQMSDCFYIGHFDGIWVQQRCGGH
jgi:hypothetical protein